MLAVQRGARQLDSGRDEVEPIRDYQCRLRPTTQLISGARRARSRFRKVGSGPDLLPLPQMAALMRGLAREQWAQLKPQER